MKEDESAFPSSASSAVLRFLFSEPIIFALVLLDFIIVGVGYYRPLLPIFAKDILHVGPAGYGILSSAPAIGGMIGTVSLLFFGDVERKGQLALWSFLSYALALGIFALSTHMGLSIFLLGFRTGQFAASRNAPNQFSSVNSRPRARPRFLGFQMFSQGANSVGATEVGFTAALLGAPGSLLFGCAVGGLLTLGCWAAMPGLRQFGMDHRGSPGRSDVTRFALL